VKTNRRDLFSVSLLGVAVCVAGVAGGFAVLKENRLSKGSAVFLWTSAGSIYSVLFVALMLVIVVVLIARRSSAGTPLVLAGAGNLIILLVFLALVSSARNLLSGAQQFSRVAPGPGSWLLFLGGYIVTTAACREIDNLIARNFLTYFFAVPLFVMAATGLFSNISVAQEFIAKSDRFKTELINHLSLAFSSVGLAAVIGVPLGIMTYRKRKTEKPVFFMVNTAQTIPSLALFGLLIAPLSFLSNQFPVLRAIGIRGIGAAPALIALTLYALLPITRNTYTSLKVVDSAIIEAGRGMGMGRISLLFSIEIPLAAPLLLNGLRLAAVQAIGNTAVAALIGAGGLGFFIFQGLGQAAADLILLGTIPVVLLAVLIDRLMQVLIRLLTPAGIRRLKTGEEGAI
jgi:osmoprotectant transport system permease protein